MAGILSVQQIQGLATATDPTTVQISSGHTLHMNGLMVGYHETKRTNSFTMSSNTATEVFTSSQRLIFSPKYSTSKLLVRASLDVKWAGGSNGTKVFVYRDGSSISSGIGNGTFIFGYQESPNNNNHFAMSQQMMIDASSTASTTFSIYISRFSGSSGTAECGHWGPTVLSVTELAQ